MGIEIKDGRFFLRVILLLFLLLGLIFFIIIPWIKADRIYEESEYHGKINKIEYRVGFKGAPHILIDSVWHFLTLDELKIEKYIKEGDSIVKEKGRKIKIYRKYEGKYEFESVH